MFVPIFTVKITKRKKGENLWNCVNFPKNWFNCGNLMLIWEAAQMMFRIIVGNMGAEKDSNSAQNTSQSTFDFYSMKTIVRAAHL